MNDWRGFSAEIRSNGRVVWQTDLREWFKNSTNNTAEIIYDNGKLHAC